jgi:toxin ParE1/3/4
VSLPVIVRPTAEADIKDAFADFETIRPGLGQQFTKRVREVLNRIESMPEIYGVVWQDVRAARIKQFRHVIYYVVFADRVEVLAVLHGSRNPGSWQRRR